eukprot:CAMPEP_0172357774 /NCGR_PEP_ID=MMETSP1060-20121228/2102_1 /TAXON_ID=37318 /ORGANISM="Pseudo-nitzschia pungens, Strain cf. cingulata" /LENGTH=301 /DNA_ID=CAMNT_0013078595 /DNA_START=222 /DNA_END=1127 /DNA_ORIENTATION=+
MDDEDNKNANAGDLRASSTVGESVEDFETNQLVQLLALQSYHLPGNNWLQDWWQFMSNNHPVFGICCHNKVHPIKACARIFALIGTITFGLAMTNVFYLFFLWNPEFDRVVASITTDSGTQFVLTTGMLLVWTIGGGVHSFFNLVLWHIAACACCQRGGVFESCAWCPSFGTYFVRFFVACCVGFCGMIVLLRIAINGQENNANDFEEGTTNDPGIDTVLDDQLDLVGPEFIFVTTYLVEITLALFVYDPIGGTILFSGILACGFMIPVLGGRPYDVASVERRNSRRQHGNSSEESMREPQ